MYIIYFLFICFYRNRLYYFITPYRLLISNEEDHKNHEKYVRKPEDQIYMHM